MFKCLTLHSFSVPQDRTNTLSSFRFYESSCPCKKSHYQGRSNSSFVQSKSTDTYPFFHTGKYFTQRWILSYLSYFSYFRERFTSATLRKQWHTVAVTLSLQMSSRFSLHTRRETKSSLAGVKFVGERRECFNFTCPPILVFFRLFEWCISP